MATTRVAEARRLPSQTIASARCRRSSPSPGFARMRRLATWSGRRVMALWLVWFVLLASIVALYLGSQWRNQAPSAVQNVGDLGPVAEQHTDVVVSVVGNPTVLAARGSVAAAGSARFPDRPVAVCPEPSASSATWRIALCR